MMKMYRRGQISKYEHVLRMQIIFEKSHSKDDEEDDHLMGTLSQSRQDIEIV